MRSRKHQNIPLCCLFLAAFLLLWLPLNALFSFFLCRSNSTFDPGEVVDEEAACGLPYINTHVFKFFSFFNLTGKHLLRLDLLDCFAAYLLACRSRTSSGFSQNG